MTVVPLSSTTASSPLYQPEPFVWSAWARMVAFALAWVFAMIGLGASNGESAQAASFPIVAVLVFASPAFVPVSGMPQWLQGFANYQPVGCVVNAVRALCLGGSFGDETAKWVALSILWSIGIIAVFAPLAVAKYRKAA